VGVEVPPVRYTCTNKIPFARGLGSSSAAIVSGIIGGLALAGHQLSVYGESPYSKGGSFIEPEELLQIASDIEGHPDNVCPCIYGGIHLAIKTTDESGSHHWRSSRVNCPFDMQLIAYVPDKVGETSALRKVVPHEYSREDVIYNLGRMGFLINTLNQGILPELRWGVEDKMHQNQRGEAVYSHLQPVIDAAVKAGAHAAYLSGAGPTVLAVTSGAAGDLFTQKSAETNETSIAVAMNSAGSDAGWPGRVYISRPHSIGAYISAANPPYSHGTLEYLGGNKDTPL
jgi:homoserine kinase